MLPTFSMSVVRKHFWQVVSAVVRRLLLAEEVRLERVHARGREQDGRVVRRRDERRRRRRLWSRCSKKDRNVSRISSLVVPVMPPSV